MGNAGVVPDIPAGIVSLPRCVPFRDNLGRCKGSNVSKTADIISLRSIAPCVNFSPLTLSQDFFAYYNFGYVSDEDYMRKCSSLRAGCMRLLRFISRPSSALCGINSIGLDLFCFSVSIKIPGHAKLSVTNIPLRLRGRLSKRIHSFIHPQVVLTDEPVWPSVRVPASAIRRKKKKKKKKKKKRKEKEAEEKKKKRGQKKGKKKINICFVL